MKKLLVLSMLGVFAMFSAAEAASRQGCLAGGQEYSDGYERGNGQTCEEGVWRGSGGHESGGGSDAYRGSVNMVDSDRRHSGGGPYEAPDPTIQESEN